MKNIRKTISFLAVAAVAALGAGFALNNTVTASAEVAITDAITLTNGASIRIDAPLEGGEQLGAIRFKANVVDASIIDGENVEYGILVAKYTDALTTENFVFNNEEGTDLVADNAWQKVSNKDTDFNYDETSNSFSFVSTGISMSDYNTQLAARAYVKTGSGYAYTPFTVENNVRAVSNVAQDSIKDTTKEGNINDPESAIHKYRPQVLNMMGNKLVTGTVAEDLTGDLQLVGEETIDIGEVSGSYSFAYNTGDYALRLVRDTAIDYEYSLSLGATSVVKDLAKTPFYMNNGTTNIDVGEKLYWGKATTAKGKTDFMTIKEDGVLSVDGTTCDRTLDAYWWPQLRVDLTGGNEMVDNYFYGIAFDYNFIALPSETDNMIQSGTENSTISYKPDGKQTANTKTRPYVADMAVSLGEGKMKGAFAFDADPDIGTNSVCSSNFINIFVLSNNAVRTELTDCKFEVSNLQLTQLPPITVTSNRNVDGENNLQLRGTITNKWSSVWGNTDFNSIWNENLGYAIWGTKANATSGFDPIPFFKWKSTNPNVIDIKVKDGHSSEKCASEETPCSGHYDVVKGSEYTTAQAEMHVYLQIDDGPIYSMLYRANIGTAPAA